MVAWEVSRPTVTDASRGGWGGSIPPASGAAVVDAVDAVVAVAAAAVAAAEVVLTTPLLPLPLFPFSPSFCAAFLLCPPSLVVLFLP